MTKSVGNWFEKSSHFQVLIARECVYIFLHPYIKSHFDKKQSHNSLAKLSPLETYSQFKTVYTR